MDIRDLSPDQIAALSTAMAAGVDIESIARKATRDARASAVRGACTLLRGCDGDVCTLDALTRVRAQFGDSVAESITLGDVHRAVRAGDVLRKRAKKDGTPAPAPAEGAPLQSRDDRRSAARLSIVQGERGASPRAVARAVAAWDARGAS